MKNYNRFDVQKPIHYDQDSWIAAAIFLTAWGIVAVLVALESFGFIG